MYNLETVINPLIVVSTAPVPVTVIHNRMLNIKIVTVDFSVSYNTVRKGRAL
jgi:hypothetical protein